MAQRVFSIPLQNFPSNITEQEVNVSIETNSYVFFFQINPIDQNLYLSCYGNNRSPIYFGSYKCVFTRSYIANSVIDVNQYAINQTAPVYPRNVFNFGTYINKIDNGFPYLLFFVNTTQIKYDKIDFNALNNGVVMYAVTR